ncbi:uncharacterized protein LOC116298797 [Actinia tenebrosa]|uniref:Uncharacterized protein LOC116298797 n=1 Tax=Actinia tenebrosa TaxID=6105 RepID=A0A6P8I7C1_ACTTE|nr:uncharacterized protein LOC116298797 [Actinia tenebrosa]
MNNDTTYNPNMKTAVSSFRFQRTSLKKRLDKYQEQHSKTLREILQNQKDLTRSLSLESEQSLNTTTCTDKHEIFRRRRACSLYGTEHEGSIAVECDDGQYSVTDSALMVYSKYDRRSELFLSNPVKTQTNGKLSASSFLPTKPRSASFVTSIESKTTNDKRKRVLKRQARIEKSQESEIQKSLIEQTKNAIIANQERSLPSSKVNKDALKDQKHDKHKMNLTEKSQQTKDKRTVNSLHEYEVQTTGQSDKEKSILNLFKNKNTLLAVSKQNANLSRQTELGDNYPIKSVNDISRTILEPSVIIKQRLRPTKSLSPIGTRNTMLTKQRSKTFTGETENQGSYSENPARKQVQMKTKSANPSNQYLERCYRNAWSGIDDNFTDKILSTSKGETSTPSPRMSLRKESDVEKYMSSCEGDKTVSNQTEKKDRVELKSYEFPTIESRCDGSGIDNDMLMCNPKDKQSREINKNEELRTETVNDHVMNQTPVANQISEGNSETDCHSLNKKDIPRNTAKHPSGNTDSRDKKDSQSLLDTQSKGWTKLRAIPLKRLQEISDMRETERTDLPVLHVRDSRLPDTPGLMSFRQVVLAAIKKDKEQAKLDMKKKAHEGEISKERLNEIQQPTESFLRQTFDKKILHYATHAPRPLTEERPKRGPEFHAVAKGIHGFQTLSSVVNTNRSLRADKIRKKSTLPYTRTQDTMANGQKTISEMMDEVKNCRYLRNKEHVT